MEKVYSDSFILDCADPFKVVSCISLQHVRNLIEKRALQISLFEDGHWFEKIANYRNGSEIERYIYQQVMSWFSSERFKRMAFDSYSLEAHYQNVFSSVWLESSEEENAILEFLDKKGLLSLIRDDLYSNEVDWIFKVTELPAIKYDKKFLWKEYLEPYQHITPFIFIWDRYFLYSWKGSLYDLIAPFADYSDLRIEIVSELLEGHKSYFYGVECLKKLKQEFASRISFYSLSPEVSSRFHDRYLLTNYCLLKSEPGFAITKKGNKAIRDTSPTLIGRYTEGNHKWKTEMANWEKRKNQICRNISHLEF